VQQRRKQFHARKTQIIYKGRHILDLSHVATKDIVVLGSSLEGTYIDNYNIIIRQYTKIIRNIDDDDENNNCDVYETFT